MLPTIFIHCLLAFYLVVKCHLVTTCFDAFTSVTEKVVVYLVCFRAAKLTTIQARPKHFAHALSSQVKQRGSGRAELITNANGNLKWEAINLRAQSSPCTYK